MDNNEKQNQEVFDKNDLEIIHENTFKNQYEGVKNQELQSMIQRDVSTEKKTINKTEVKIKEVVNKLKNYFKKNVERVKLAYKNKILVIVTCVLALVMIITSVVYNFSDYKAFNVINKFTNESSEYNSKLVKKNINKLLKSDDGRNFEKLLKIGIDSKVIIFTTDLLQVATTNYNDIIDYSNLMKILFDSTDFNLNKLLINTIKDNNKSSNQEWFIKSQEGILNTNNLKFISNYKIYLQNDFGDIDKIHKLDVNIEDLINLQIKKEIDIDLLKEFIDYKNIDKISNTIIDSIKKIVEKEEIELAKSFLSVKDELNLEVSEEKGNEFNILSQLVESLDSRNKLKAEKDRLIKKYEDSDSDLEVKNESLKSAQADKVNAEKELTRLNQQIEKYKPFTISGYIIAKTGTFNNEIIGSGENYEVRYTSDVPFSNQTEVDRFLLSTVSTSYKSKGNFSLEVVYIGEDDVTVKEEFGGFTQTWMRYGEYSGKIKEANNEVILLLQERIDEEKTIIAKVDAIQSQINELNDFIQNYDVILKESENKIIEEENKIEELKKQLEII